MFLLRQPTSADIDRFLRESRDLPLSYSPVGIVNDVKTDRRIDEQVVVVGRGEADFARARTALQTWKQFDIGWVRLCPSHAPVKPGTVVGVLIRHLGMWSLNGCRVVFTVGDGQSRYGFAYGTLTNHAEAGEELFEVFIDQSTEDVMYRIRATSWPYAALAYLGQPVVRLLQERFRRDSARVMKRATTLSAASL